MGKVLFLFIFAIAFHSAQAEYRVFQLLIYKNPPKKPSTGNDAAKVKEAANSNDSRQPASNTDPKAKVQPTPLPSGLVLLSTLDPLQYRTYNPLPADMSVVYTDTWRCRGRTNGLDFCPNPKPSKPKK